LDAFGVASALGLASGESLGSALGVAFSADDEFDEELCVAPAVDRFCASAPVPASAAIAVATIAADRMFLVTEIM
jgi:hypothetical protein